MTIPKVINNTNAETSDNLVSEMSLLPSPSQKDIAFLLGSSLSCPRSSPRANKSKFKNNFKVV